VPNLVPNLVLRHIDKQELGATGFASADYDLPDPVSRAYVVVENALVNVFTIVRSYFG
jgi:hypothetical protein